MKIVIVAARRTPIASFQGAFKDVSAITLGSVVATEVLRGLRGEDVADVIVGNVLQAGLGMNPARQIALASGLPVSVPGQTVNRVCGSGMQAVLSAVQALKAGDGRLYLAGGTECMSRAPYLLQQLRSGNKLGDVPMIDSVVHDGLTDPTHRYHMGITAENVAESCRITREDQDAFALASHRCAALAQTQGLFDQEIVPVTVPSRKGAVLVDKDESIRSEASLEALSKLKSVFKPNGTVTAGNSSGLNDGAAMVAVCEDRYAEEHGLQPLAEIVNYAVVGIDPAYMGLGPSSAVPLAIGRAGLKLSDIDLFELNEAFSAQSIAVCRNLQISADKINVGGGAIALGHPIGASGTRVIVTLTHALRSKKLKYGVASLCIGGGMGISIVLKSIP